MERSRQIAGILGPGMVAVLASEFPLVQPHLYDEQIPPVVYLSGVLMFVAGMAVVRSHNVWRRDWTVLVTLVGWSLLGLGLVRMFRAEAYRAASATTRPTTFMLIEGTLLVVGLILTWKAYAGAMAPDSPR